MHISRITISTIIGITVIGFIGIMLVLASSKKPSDTHPVPSTSEATSTSLCAEPSTLPSVLRPSVRTQNFLYIAHTLGLTPEGVAGTNTKEAFEHSYSKGFRLFEADIIKTKDNHIIVAHDNHEQFWGTPNLFEDSYYADLQGLPYNNTYTTMDLAALLELLQTYPDTNVILDIKFNTIEEYYTILQLVIDTSIQIIGEDQTYSRLIPQIYTREDIIHMPTICDFSDIIFTQYRNNLVWNDVLDFLALYPRITAVATQYPQRYKDMYGPDLNALDRALYVHPITDTTVQTMFIQKQIGVFSTVSTTIQ